MITLRYAKFQNTKTYKNYARASNVCARKFATGKGLKTVEQPFLKTNKQGKKVVMGPPSKVREGYVSATTHQGSIEIVGVTVVTVGKVFQTEDGPRVYGYLEKPKPRKKSSGGYRRSRYRRRECPTGGNCSSFGDSSSCGAPDCDGF